MKMYNLDSPAYLEAKGLAKVWEAYYKQCPNEEIMEVGFNENSGYVYIALENGISVASAFGQEVDFIVTDFETGEEYFEEAFDDAVGKQVELEEENE